MDYVGFERLYADRYEAVLRYCLRRTSRDLAVDAASETFMVAWRRRHCLPSERPLPWLYGVARKVLGNQRRSHSRAVRVVERLGGSNVAAEDGPEDTLVRDEDAQDVRRALQKLAHDDREIVRLAGWERLSRDDLAVVLGCSPNAASKRLSRALDRLARHLSVTRTAGTRFFEIGGGAA